MRAPRPRCVHRNLHRVRPTTTTRAGGRIPTSRARSAAGWCPTASPYHRLDAMGCGASSASTSTCPHCGLISARRSRTNSGVAARKCISCSSSNAYRPSEGPRFCPAGWGPMMRAPSVTCRRFTAPTSVIALPWWWVFRRGI